MDKATLARRLAPSLVAGAWDKATITTALERRLPTPLQRLAPEIARDLLRLLPASYAPLVRHVTKELLAVDGFQRVFNYCTRRRVWPGFDLTPPAMSPVPPFHTLDLPQLATLDALADWLMVPLERLDYLADITHRYEAHGDMAVNQYHYHLHPKKTGGHRLIEAPKQGLKALQRQILRGIIDRVPTHPDAFGFVPGKTCWHAAQRHCNEDVVICFDLREFFPSIASARIFGLFRSLGYPQTIAHYLTGLCTTTTPPRVFERMSFTQRHMYRAPHLPQGAPTSPALANHMAFGLDRRLAGLAKKLGASYSRYADDLCFSGDREITKPVLRTVPEIVQSEGFTLNLGKTRVMPQTGAQRVTGIIVNQHLNIDRQTFDRIKATIHALNTPKDPRRADPMVAARLRGQIDWVTTLNPNRGRKLERLLDKALGV